MNTPTKVRYSKDVEILGFRSVVERARQSLGLSPGSSFLDIPPDSHLFGYYSLAVWTILDVFELPGTDEPFVMNAIAFGVDKALSTKSISQLHVLIPEVPEALLPELQDFLEAESRIILDDGKIPRLVDPWVELWEPARVFQGLSALRYVLESQPLILLDVTDASGEDIRRAVPLITQLRSESNLGRLVQREFQPTILMPSLPSAFTYRLAVRLMEFLQARTSIKEWPEVTEDGIPSGVWNPWDMLTGESVPALASISRGPRAIIQMARTVSRIYFDVTCLSAENIRAAIPLITGLKSRQGMHRPSSRAGAGTTIDETKALAAARMSLDGMSIKNIANHFGWRWYQDPEPSGSSPITQDYIRKGNEILAILEKFEWLIRTTKATSRS